MIFAVADRDRGILPVDAVLQLPGPSEAEMASMRLLGGTSLDSLPLR